MPLARRGEPAFVRIHYTVRTPQTATANDLVPFISRTTKPVNVALIGAEDADVEFGEVSLKALLQPICASRPELLLDKRIDFSLSAIDAQESYISKMKQERRQQRRRRSNLFSGPSPTGSSPYDIMSEPPSSPEKEPTTRRGPNTDVFEGKGMLRWVLGERGVGTTMAIGRVVDDYLEVDLALVQHDACSQSDFASALSSMAGPSTPGAPSSLVPPPSPSASSLIASLSRTGAQPQRFASGVRPALPRSANMDSMVHSVLPSLVNAMLTDPSRSADLMPAIVTLLQQYAPPTASQSTAAAQPLRSASELMPAPPVPAPRARTESNEPPSQGPAKKRKTLTTQPFSADRGVMSTSQLPKPLELPTIVESPQSLESSEPAELAKSVSKPVEPMSSIPPYMAAPLPPSTDPLSSDIGPPGKRAKSCSNCGTTNSKQWFRFKARKDDDKSRAHVGRQRLCTDCASEQQKSIDDRRAQKQSAATSPPREAERPAALPAAATSPVRPVTRARLAAPTPSNKTPVFVHQDSPGTALSRILGVGPSTAGGSRLDAPILFDANNVTDRLRASRQSGPLATRSSPVSKRKSSPGLLSSAQDEVFPPFSGAHDSDEGTSPPLPARPSSPSPAGKSKTTKRSFAKTNSLPQLTTTAPTSTPHGSPKRSPTRPTADWTPSLLRAAKIIASSPPGTISKLLFQNDDPTADDSAIAFNASAHGAGLEDLSELFTRSAKKADAGGDGRSADAIQHLLNIFEQAPTLPGASSGTDEDLFSSIFGRPL